LECIVLLTASLFVTCLVDLFYPEVGEAIVKIEHETFRAEGDEGMNRVSVWDHMGAMER
jgi:hypothetical protein